MSKKNLQALKSLKRNYLILFILFTVLTFALIYNSCSSEGSKSVKFSKILNNLGAGFSVTINDGSYATKEENVTLTFEAPEKSLRGEVVDYELKVSRNSDCSDGEWEDYKTTKTWRLDNGDDIEKRYFIYTKFREKRLKNVNYVSRSGATGESECVHDSIVYDTRPPELEITSGPLNPTSQKNANFIFSGKDFGEISFQCRINHPNRIDPAPTSQVTCDNTQESESGSWQPCSSPINYTAENLGTSTMAIDTQKNIQFSLKGTDLAGNCSMLLHGWVVDRTIPSITPNCPELNSKTSPDSIEAELTASSTNDTFSLICKDANGNFTTNCKCESSCSNITISSSNTPIKHSIKKESFIEKTKAPGYIEYSLNVKLKNTTSGELSRDAAPCKWYVDSTPPDVELQLVTTGGNNYNQNGEFKFIVSDNSDFNNSGVPVALSYSITPSPNTSGTYSIGGCNTNSGCSFSVKNIITPGTNSPKEYTISVSATDLAGNQSSKDFKFYVMGGVTSHSKTHEVTESSGKADILFVLDDSESMSDESTELGASFSGIISALGSLKWQIAVTSMEKSPQGLTNFGKLVQLISNTSNTFLEGKYIISSQTTACDPHLYCHPTANKSELEEVFKRTISESTTGDNNFTFEGWKEYGIESVNVLLDYYDHHKNEKDRKTTYPSPDTNGLNAIDSFFRENSTFVVIFITDELNCDDKSNTACHNNNHNSINHPENLIDTVRTAFEDDKKFISYPIIHNRTDRANYTDDYLKLAEATQGRRDKDDSINPVIWVDVNPSNTQDRGKNTSCSADSSSGVYTKDLCEISEDILNVVQSSISLECNNPIIDAQHTITYLFRANSSSGFQTFTKDANDQLTIQGQTIKVTESSSTNRILLENTTGQDNIPSGTYQVNYFCPSREIVYASTRSNAESALTTIRQQQQQTQQQPQQQQPRQQQQPQPVTP